MGAGVIIGQHPYEEAAGEVGVNLVKALNDAGADANIFIVPDKVTCPKILPAVFKAFESGGISEKTLKANLSHSNPGREALLWVKELVDSNPDRVFYSLHNYVARYNGRGEVPSVGWGYSDPAGWCRLNELAVRTYDTELDAVLHVRKQLGKFWGKGGLTADEAESMRCHIQVALGPSGYGIQTGDRNKLKLLEAKDVKVKEIAARMIEVPGIQTHFKGQKTPKLTDEDLRDRFMFQGGLSADEDGMRRTFGLTKSIGDRALVEQLLWVYCMRWCVFDREINCRAGLTGEHIVNPLREFIIKDLRDTGEVGQ